MKTVRQPLRSLRKNLCCSCLHDLVVSFCIKSFVDYLYEIDVLFNLQWFFTVIVVHRWKILIGFTCFSIWKIKSKMFIGFCIVINQLKKMGRTLKFILLHFIPTQAHTQDLNVLFEHGNCSLDKDILESIRMGEGQVPGP